MPEDNGGLEYAYRLARTRIAAYEKLINQLTLDMTLLCAKHQLGKDRTAQRMTKMLHKAKT